MLDALRTLLLAGVGAIDVTDEKMRSVIEELSRRGELAADEARELASLWAQGSKARGEALAARVAARRKQAKAAPGTDAPTAAEEAASVVTNKASTITRTDSTTRQQPKKQPRSKRSKG